MVEILTAPDIIDPFKATCVFYLDRIATQNLGLDDLLRIASSGHGSSVTAEQVITKLTGDYQTIKYRQDILEDLMLNNELRKTVCSFIDRIRDLNHTLNEFKERDLNLELRSGLALLRKYISVIHDLPNLDSANSNGLQEVDAYLKQISDSDIFKETVGLVERIEKLSGVHFHVSFDKEGMPTSMSIFDLIERKEGTETELVSKESIPFWRRILQRRKEEPQIEEEQERIEGRALQERGCLNPLGNAVYRFVEDQFTSIIKEYTKQIKEITRLAAPLLFYTKFSEYFVKLRESGSDICRPKILSKEERRVVVRNAKNPTLSGKGEYSHEVVTNDIEYNPDGNMFVITGPNNGGKTTYAKTVGLIQILAQSGLFVPAESAEISLVDGVYTHFVTQADHANGNGGYKNELERMKYIFEHASPFSLVILDEPCKGTDYEEGQRQTLIHLDGLHKLGAATYLITHMHGVAREVSCNRFSAAENLTIDCVDDGKRLIYTFKIKTGASGKSYGEEIAREIGLTHDDIALLVSKNAERNGYTQLLRG